MRITLAQSFPGAGFGVYPAFQPQITAPQPQAVRWDWTNPAHAGTVLLLARQLGVIPAVQPAFEHKLDQYLQALVTELTRNNMQPSYGMTLSDNGLTITVDSMDPVSGVVRLTPSLDLVGIANRKLGSLGGCWSDFDYEDETIGELTLAQLGAEAVGDGGAYAATKTQYGQRVKSVPPQAGYTYIVQVRLVGEDGETVDQIDVPVRAPNMAMAPGAINGCVIAEATKNKYVYDSFDVVGVRVMNAEEYAQYNTPAAQAQQ